MATLREQVDRQATVARLIASGSNPSEVSRILGCNRATVYRDLARIRARALDRVLLDEEAEAAAIDAELAELDALFRQHKRHLEERTEFGTREHAALLKSVLEAKRLKLSVAMELGVFRKAVQRHLVLPGDELANLEGDELEQYLANLDEVEQRLNRASKRGKK